MGISASVISMGSMSANMSISSFGVVATVVISDAERGLTVLMGDVDASANVRRRFLVVGEEFVRSAMGMAGGGSLSKSSLTPFSLRARSCRFLRMVFFGAMRSAGGKELDGVGETGGGSGGGGVSGGAGTGSVEVAMGCRGCGVAAEERTFEEISTLVQMLK